MNEPYKILIVDDEKEYRDTYRMILEAKGFTVGDAESVDEALSALEREYYPIVLTDVMMPNRGGMDLLNEINHLYQDRIQVIMVTGYGSVETAVESMRQGAFGYFIKSHKPEELLAEIEKAKKLVRLQVQQQTLARNNSTPGFLATSKSPRMREVFQMVDAVANSNANVLLLGESGVGKEIIAQMIHQQSERCAMPFVAINCQSFSESLLESELFGYEKGAFTGAATKRIGRFEESNGGTIFLDEIGEMSLSTQVKLLRVLESKRIERIGSNKPIYVDYRLINATNRNLTKAIKEGYFREDLLYRINTITIDIPPLRERKEDLDDLIHFFIALHCREMKKEIVEIDEATYEALLHYDYPGNIRELKNVIERLIVLSKDQVMCMSPHALKEYGVSSEKKQLIGGATLSHLSYREARKQFESDYIQKVMEAHHQNMTHAAKHMEMSRRQLFNKIVEYQLKV